MSAARTAPKSGEALTESECERLGCFRSPHLLFRDCEAMACLLLDLCDTEREVAFPCSRKWLADELCTILNRLGEVTGLSKTGGVEA